MTVFIRSAMVREMLLHRARLGHDDGLEQRHRNQQHLAARLGDEVREHRVAGHQRHFVERVAGFQSAERLPRRAVAEDRGLNRAAQDHAKVRRFVALVKNASLASNDWTFEPLTKVLQSFGREVAKRCHVLVKERCSIRGVHGRSGILWMALSPWRDEDAPVQGIRQAEKTEMRATLPDSLSGTLLDLKASTRANHVHDCGTVRRRKVILPT